MGLSYRQRKAASTMDLSSEDKKVNEPQQESYAPSSEAEVVAPRRVDWQYLKHYFTSKEGWIGDYVRQCPQDCAEPN